ncbi:MAG: hypothetical protein HY055_01050 [Magnetospirillum sp.]|nr:hypothetical protein [Magnetospirillum sp.]
MGDKEYMGLLMGLGLAMAFVVYLIRIYRHPERYEWLALTGEPAKPAAGTVRNGAARPPGTESTASD